MTTLVLEPSIFIIGILTLIVLAALTTPLAAAVFFSGALILFLTPNPLPEGFLFSYSLAMRLNSPALISIPLFALAGELAVAAGITERLLDAADALAGGGSHSVSKRTLLGCSLYASVSGVGPAAVSEEGKRLIPEMLRAGYRREAAAGLLACAAGMSIVIPASIPLTIYAATVGMQTNIVFTASFLPGVCMGLLLLAATIVYDRWCNFRAVAMPLSAKQRWRTLYNARWALLLPVLLLSFLFSGFLTAPEAAAFASAYSLCIGKWLHKRLDWASTREAMVRAAVAAAAVLLMAGMGGLAIQFLDATGSIERLCVFLFTATGGRVGSILVINIILLLAGCILDMPAIINLVAPLFIPLAALGGMDLPQFGVMVVVNLAIGLITPPQAYNLTAAAKEAGTTMWQAARGSMPFFCAMLVCLGLVSYWPDLSLWLPRLFGWPV